MHRLIQGALGVWLGIGVLIAGGAEAAEEPVLFDFGPLASRQYDVHGTLRLRVLGPFFERASDGDGRRLTAVRPLFSRFREPELERRRTEYLWPVAQTKTFRDQTSGRILVAFWTRFDRTDPASRYRFWLLPVYFQGRDTHGQSYAALFPLGGRIHEILGQDEVGFLLFPLYLRTEINTIETHGFLWPFISHTDGRGIYRFRVLPFYGQNRHRDRYNKKFVMWPFWSSAEYFYSGSSGSGYILFPLWGRLDLDDQQSWMVLPPFFRVSHGDRGNRMLLPWPVFQRRTGEIRKTWVWPLWGQKRMPGVQTRFYLWPLVQQEKRDLGREIARRLNVLPVYYSETRHERVLAPPPRDSDTPVPQGRMTANYRKIWPLWSYRREQDTARFRILDLWPLKESGPMERNYAPLWTLYQRVRHEDASDTEALWGLYRRQRRGADRVCTSVFPLVQWSRDDRADEVVRHWSLLKGLIGYERQGTNRNFRLLYVIRWGADQEPSH